MSELEIVLIIVCSMELLMNMGLMVVVAFLFGAMGKGASSDGGE